jgi:hypothetical protein
MEQAIRKALKGLLLPDLQDIVLEYLPDRGILVVCTHWIANNGQPVTISLDRVMYTNEFGQLSSKIYPLWKQYRMPTRFITFERKQWDFKSFNLDFTPWLPLDTSKTYRVTVIYQGDPSIVEINTI